MQIDDKTNQISNLQRIMENRLKLSEKPAGTLSEIDQNNQTNSHIKTSSGTFEESSIFSKLYNQQIQKIQQQQEDIDSPRRQVPRSQKDAQWAKSDLATYLLRLTDVLAQKAWTIRSDKETGFGCENGVLLSCLINPEKLVQAALELDESHKH